MPMTNAPVKIFDWGRLYQDALTTEILRSERRRVTILAGLFAFAACVYSFFAFVPGPLAPEFRVRFQAQWPWIMSLHGLVVAYEWALRAGIGWMLEHRRQPYVAVRFLNAFLETSIPTVLMFMAVSLMGARDALGSPAFLLYFFFILLSILRLDVRLCLFTRPGRSRGALHFCVRCDRHIGARGAGVVLAHAGFSFQSLSRSIDGRPCRRTGR